MGYWAQPYHSLQPPLTLNWIDKVPLFIIPVVIVGGALLYSGVIPTASGGRYRLYGGVIDPMTPSERYRQASDWWRLVVAPVSAVALVVVWTALWMVVALVAAELSEEKAGTSFYGGWLVFAAALLGWASPFVVSAVRRRGPAWWVLAAAAVFVAGWWIVDLYTNPFNCACGA